MIAVNKSKFGCHRVLNMGFCCYYPLQLKCMSSPLPVLVSQKGENVFFLFCESWKLNESLHNLTDQTESPNLSSSTVYETIESVHKNVTNHTLHICRVDEELYQE